MPTRLVIFVIGFCTLAVGFTLQLDWGALGLIPISGYLGLGIFIVLALLAQAMACDITRFGTLYLADMYRGIIQQVCSRGFNPDFTSMFGFIHILDSYRFIRIFQ